MSASPLSQKPPPQQERVFLFDCATANYCFENYGPLVFSFLAIETR